MRVDQTRRNQTTRSVDCAQCRRLASRRADSGDETIGNGDPATGNFTALFVNCRNEQCVAYEQVDGQFQLLRSTSSLPACRISASRFKKYPIPAAIAAVERPTTIGNASKTKTMMMAPGMVLPYWLEGPGLDLDGSTKRQ